MFELGDREIALIGVTIALLSFGGGVWRIWRDRPRLLFFVSSIRFRNEDDKQDSTFVKITIANVGFRPSIIKHALFLGDQAAFHVGIHDEPGIFNGIRNQKFPIIINPGDSVEFHPVIADILKKNQDEIECRRYKYMLLIDGFDHKFVLRMEDILAELKMLKSHQPLKGWWRKLVFYVSCKIYFFRHRKLISS